MTFSTALALSNAATDNRLSTPLEVDDVAVSAELTWSVAEKTLCRQDVNIVTPATELFPSTYQRKFLHGVTDHHERPKPLIVCFVEDQTCCHAASRALPYRRFEPLGNQDDMQRVSAEFGLAKTPIIARFVKRPEIVRSYQCLQFLTSIQRSNIIYQLVYMTCKRFKFHSVPNLQNGG